jgi:hypothetical protein
MNSFKNPLFQLTVTLTFLAAGESAVGQEFFNRIGGGDNSRWKPVFDQMLVISSDYCHARALSAKELRTNNSTWKESIPAGYRLGNLANHVVNMTLPQIAHTSDDARWMIATAQEACLNLNHVITRVKGVSVISKNIELIHDEAKRQILEAARRLAIAPNAYNTDYRMYEKRRLIEIASIMEYSPEFVWRFLAQYGIDTPIWRGEPLGR